jgi:hypothetical protein
MLWGLIALALEEDLHLMTIGVGKAVGRAGADVAVRPADSESTRDFRTGGRLSGFVDRVNGGQPYGSRSFARSDFNSQGV